MEQKVLRGRNCQFSVIHEIYTSLRNFRHSFKGTVADNPSNSYCALTDKLTCLYDHLFPDFHKGQGRIPSAEIEKGKNEFSVIKRIKIRSPYREN
jgi:hypothetical protein